MTVWNSEDFKVSLNLKTIDRLFTSIIKIAVDCLHCYTSILIVVYCHDFTFLSKPSHFTLSTVSILPFLFFTKAEQLSLYWVTIRYLQTSPFTLETKDQDFWWFSDRCYKSNQELNHNPIMGGGKMPISFQNSTWTFANDNVELAGCQQTEHSPRRCSLTPSVEDSVCFVTDCSTKRLKVDKRSPIQLPCEGITVWQ